MKTIIIKIISCEIGIASTLELNKNEYKNLFLIYEINFLKVTPEYRLRSKNNNNNNIFEMHLVKELQKRRTEADPMARKIFMALRNYSQPVDNTRKLRGL